jgi:hypothetical protein
VNLSCQVAVCTLNDLSLGNAHWMSRSVIDLATIGYRFEMMGPVAGLGKAWLASCLTLK